MARVETGEWPDEPTRVYVAFKLADARRAEAGLSEADVAYTVTPEPLGRTLFGSPRLAAVFAVRPADTERAASALARAGLTAGLLVDPPS